MDDIHGFLGSDQPGVSIGICIFQLQQFRAALPPGCAAPFFFVPWCDLRPVRHCAMCNAVAQAETQCNLAQAVEASKDSKGSRRTSLRQLIVDTSTK